MGTTFDFLTVGGTRTGAFADAEGLFSFPNGDRYFEIVPNGQGLRLDVKAAPGGLSFVPPDAAAKNGFGEFLSSYFSVTTFSYTGDLSVGGFASFSGSLSFAESGGETLVAASGVNVQLGTAAGGVAITGAALGWCCRATDLRSGSHGQRGVDRHPRLRTVRARCSPNAIRPGPP